jgi:hypothetical protein
MDTTTNANSVPMLTSSASADRGMNAASRATTAPMRIVIR